MPVPAEVLQLVARFEAQREAYEQHRKQLYQGPGGVWRLTTQERKRILLNNIYGVDIDPQAVEVTKLSLLLKVLEGESGQTIQHEFAVFRQRALPDLGNNIKCGNSLIGPDFYDGRQLSTFEDEERYRINAFDWKVEFPEVFANKEGGFDAVVGNPPFGADYSEHDKQYFQHQFSYSKGKPETYIFFLERGISLLCPRGRLGMITPNAWLTNYYGVQIRRHVLAKTKLDQVVDLEPVRVFSGATVDTVITVVVNETPRLSEEHKVMVLRGSPDRRFTPQFQVPQSTWSSDDEAVINLHTNLAEAELLRKLDGLTSTFDDIVEYSQGVIPYLTKEEGIRNNHISQLKRGKGWLPLLESASQVRSYEVEDPKAFIHYGPWLNRSRESRFFFEPKILFHRLRKKLPRQLVGAIELRSVVNRHALSNLILRDPQDIDALYAILAIFNSRLANWWFAKRFGLLMEVGGFKVGRIPLPPKWVNVFSELAHQARKLETLHEKRQGVHSTSEVEGLRREIDQLTHDLDLLVYEFYHLTDAEIRLVEEATPAPH